MKKTEIDSKLDEIIAFSGVDKFIDTPVKRYSSGMLVRLGFAVAAHLEPDILLIDEVLAVGDAAFQKKCLGKMSDVASGGRTVIFVSHNMAAVNRLCTHGMVLDHGKLTYYGSAQEATRLYFGGGENGMAESSWIEEEAPGDSTAKLLGIKAIDSSGNVNDVHDIRKEIIILSFMDELGNIIFISPDWHEVNWGAKKRKTGIYVTRCHLPGNIFAEGMISVVAEVLTREPIYQIHFLEKDAVAFQIIDEGYNDSVRAGWGRKMPGLVRPMLEWETTLRKDSI